MRSLHLLMTYVLTHELLSIQIGEIMLTSWPRPSIIVCVNRKILILNVTGITIGYHTSFFLIGPTEIMVLYYFLNKIYLIVCLRQ